MTGRYIVVVVVVVDSLFFSQAMSKYGRVKNMRLVRDIGNFFFPPLFMNGPFPPLCYFYVLLL